MSLDSLIVDGNVYLESLKEINNHENHHCNQHIVKVGQSFSQKSLSNSIEFVWLVFEVGKESDEGPDILVSIFHKGEGFP